MSIQKMALLGGSKAIMKDPGDMFTWPIVTWEDEDAVIKVLRKGTMSDTDVTMQFEAEFSKWLGIRYALGFNSGTSAIHGALFGCKVGVGDEVICQSTTYWATVLQCYSLGATPVFADIDPNTLCIDPNDIEKRITDRTKAIVVVHYIGHPADMDSIMEIACRHGVKVIEDVSHAQGGLYKGRRLGTIGHVGGMSLMSVKSFAIGEAGMLVTNDTEIYERAIAFGHYERFNEEIQTGYLQKYAYLPMGGYKHRMHQLSSAMGRVQLKYYDERCAEIRKSMNYFWDLLKDVNGLQPHRVDESTGSNMAGWYEPHGFYVKEELGGLSITRFVEAIQAEGFTACYAGCNNPLHLHPLLNTCDVYGHGKPTRIANAARDVRQPAGSLPVSENIGKKLYSVPWFKKFRPGIIEEYAEAFRKVAENYRDLLPGDNEDPRNIGRWNFSRKKKKEDFER
jgi:Predicted pyridoxal phosphate-dependent enzyme apparently involved in regulation of cell wall biogenesis